MKNTNFFERRSNHYYKKKYLEFNKLSDVELLIKVDLLSDYESDRNFSHNLSGLLSVFSTGLLTFCIGVITIFFSIITTEVNIATDNADKKEQVLSKLTDLLYDLFFKSWESMLVPTALLFGFFSCFGMLILGYFYFSGGKKRIKYHICKHILQQRQELNKNIYYKVHSELIRK